MPLGYRIVQKIPELLFRVNATEIVLGDLVGKLLDAFF